MKRLQLFLILLVFTGFANATTYYVSSTGDGTTGTSWATAFQSPTAALASSSPVSGDEIWVQQGTYTVTTTLTWKSGVSFYGGFSGTETTRDQRSKDASLTILNGNNTARVLTGPATLTATTIWDGFTIQNGTNIQGGGAYLSKYCVLQNCIIQNNTAANTTTPYVAVGGGIFMHGTATDADSVRVINCIVKNNLVKSAAISPNFCGGGGIYVEAGCTKASIRGCTIDTNSGDGLGAANAVMAGGGVYMCDGLIANCTIKNNMLTNKNAGTGALNYTSACKGGGLEIMPQTTSIPITVTNCTITGNSSLTNAGGGISVDPLNTTNLIAAPVNITKSIISNNFAYKFGGGIWTDGKNTGSTASYAFENCIIANNESSVVSAGGGGAFINNITGYTGAVSFTNCDIVNNKMRYYQYGGAGIFYNFIVSKITNCVFWGNLNAGTGGTAVKHHIRTAGVSGNIVDYCAFDTRFVTSDVSYTSLPGKVTIELANTGSAAGKLYANFTSPTNFVGNASVATDFTSLAAADWSIIATSACVDAGKTVTSPIADIINMPRPIFNGYDIGAYEYHGVIAVQSVTTDKIDSIANPGSMDYRIMRINVNVSGPNNQLSLSRFNLNLDGTTALSDISKLTIFYTGNSNTFSTTTPFASLTPSGTTQSLAGTQSLLAGDNYFWVAYDVASSAAIGNLLYSNCSSIQLADVSSYTPVVNSIAQAKIISPSIITSNIDTIVNVNVSNHPVMKIKVNAAYSSTPSSLSQFALDLDGTTQLSDISKISLYYTGSSSSFATTTQFASITPSGTPQTLQTLTGSQTLSSGDNYFWVAYDLPTTATLGDYLYTKLASTAYSNGSCATTIASDVKVLITAPLVLTNVIDTIAYPNLSDYTIMKMNVKIPATSNSIPTVSQINLSMDNTTVLTDVSNITVYYTGSNNFFRNYNQFATAVPSETIHTTQTLTGSQTLSAGDNYFWVVYNVANAAKGNYIYAGSPLVTFSDGSSSVPTALSSAKARISTPHKYYVSNINGDDANTGDSPEHAWKSLDKVNNNIFLPGDSILFHSNSVWYGMFKANGSGALGKPITVDKYGTGTKPLIRASGKVTQAVLLQNVEYWELNNLYVSNWDSTVTYQTKAGGPLGIKIASYNFNGTMHHIKLKNILVRDINGNNTKSSNEGTGIYWYCSGATQSNIDSLIIENCEVRNVDRNGIRGSGSFGLRTSSWFPNTHLILRGCVLDSIGGDGIVIKQFDGALVEHNKIFRCRWKGTGGDNSAAIWPHSSDNVVMQYNEVAYTKNTSGANDGMSFDIDGNCKNTLMQYNYSHDNDGAFLLVISDAINSESVKCQNHIVRYNVSVNDGDKRKRLIFLPSQIDNIQIYNNSFFNNRGGNIEVFDINNAAGTPTNVNFSNNIFNFTGAAIGVLSKTSTVYSNACTFDNNVFYGNINGYGNIANTNGLTPDPKYMNNNTLASIDGGNISYIDGYKLQSTSPALNAGKLISGNGGLDYWGKAVSASLVPTIGAWNGQYFKTTVTFNTGGTVDSYTSGDVVTLPNDVTHPFVITPNTGYVVSSVKYNGTDVTSQLAAGVYTAPAITADATLDVTFEVKKFNTTITFTTGGTVDSYTNGTVLAQSYSITPSYTITPNTGYLVKTVLYNGTDVTSQLVSGIYTASALTADATLEVTFEVQKFNTTITFTTGGTVDSYSSGAVVAQSYGATPSYTITPNTGYLVKTVLYNGTDVTSQLVSGIYTATALTADATLDVMFDVNKFNTTITFTTGGTVDNYTSGDVLAQSYGTTPSYAITPSSGYLVKTVLYNGTDVTSQLVSGTYTASALTANATLDVTFEVQKFNTNITFTTGGTVDNYTSGDVLAQSYGATPSYTITPNTGYLVKTVLYNGTDVTSQLVSGIYTATALTADATLDVTFEVQKFNTTITFTTGGTVNNYTSGDVLAQSYGTTPSYTITPNTGYLVKTVLYNGTDVTSQLVSGIYTASALTADATLNVTFTSNTSTGVNDIRSAFYCYATNGGIQFTGIPAGFDIAVYNVSGINMKHFINNTSDMTINLPCGVYFVKIGTKVTKAIVK